MDGSWIARGVVAAGGIARRLYARGFSSQQRLHLAALLTLLAVTPLRAADDIKFKPVITPDDFATFSRLIAQGIYADPIAPARASGLLHFDAGIGANLVHIDDKASYWKNSVSKDITVSGGYVGVPRIIVSKGYGGGTLSASYAKINNTGAKTYGGAMDVPLVRGTVATPEVSLRGVYSKLSGVDVFKLKTYGVEAYISKGIDRHDQLQPAEQGQHQSLYGRRPHLAARAEDRTAGDPGRTAELRREGVGGVLGSDE